MKITVTSANGYLSSLIFKIKIRNSVGFVFRKLFRSNSNYRDIKPTNSFKIWNIDTGSTFIFRLSMFDIDTK